MTKAISRRLAALQAFADRQRPAVVSIHFTNGTVTTTTPGEALALFMTRGKCRELDSFQTDNPVYSGWARLLTGLLHPAPDRRIEDFE